MDRHEMPRSLRRVESSSIGAGRKRQVLAVDGGWSTTKFLTEEALTAERHIMQPGWTHSGKTRRAAE